MRNLKVNEDFSDGQLKHDVLLIEDNEIDVEAVRRSFRRDQMSRVNGSIEISVAHSLADAKPLLSSHSFHAILLDLGLPEGTGIDVLHQVLAMNLKIPIIILTGNEDDELGYEALRAGADDYLKKGAISAETLPRSVRYSIERNHRILAEAQLQQTEAEIIAAETIHRRLLPDFSPQINGLEIFGKCLPAEKIGGDLFDYLAFDELSCTGVVADVSGHGLPAAILMTELHGLLHGLIEQNVSLPRLMSAANVRTARATEAHQFITMIAYHISVEAQRLSYISSGHPAWILKANGENTQLESQHLPLGVSVKSGQMRLTQIKIDSGDLVVLPTDGIFETTNLQNVRFGIPRMLQTIRESQHRSSADIVETVLQKAKEFASGRNLMDDCSLVIIKVL